MEMTMAKFIIIGFQRLTGICGPDGFLGNDNSDDEDDDCYSNIHDCAGICDGDATIDPYWCGGAVDGVGALV